MASVQRLFQGSSGLMFTSTTALAKESVRDTVILHCLAQVRDTCLSEPSVRDTDLRLCFSLCAARDLVSVGARHLQQSFHVRDTFFVRDAVCATHFQSTLSQSGILTVLHGLLRVQLSIHVRWHRE